MTASILHAATASSLSCIRPQARTDGFEFIEPDTRGTLALVRKGGHYGANLDVSFLVRGADGEFVPLAPSRRFAIESVPFSKPPRCCVVGPDVEGGAASAAKGSTTTKGLFGLSFEDLLGSEWVQDDTITFKVVVKESSMQQHPEHAGYGHIVTGVTDHLAECPSHIEVPPPTLPEELLSLLTGGVASDLTLEAAYGEAPPMYFPCHSVLLGLRSPVFRAALTHGMSESTSRTITVRDVPPLALQVLLHFLYTDDFEQVEKVLLEGRASEPATAATSPSSAAAFSAAASAASAASAAFAASAASAAFAACQSSEVQRMAQLQAVLAAAHKYQVTRLLRWSEQQLCKHIGDETVCSLLALAHVYGSPELEHSCLRYVKANMAAVVQRPDFASLAPAVLVKSSMFCAGVGAATAGKRKRAAE